MILMFGGGFEARKKGKKHFVNLAEEAISKKTSGHPITTVYASQIVPLRASINYILLVKGFLCSEVFNTDSCVKATLQHL